MMRPDHEALLQGAIDGTLTPEEHNALQQLLARDAAARERAGELARLNALLASLGPVEAPPALVADVLARVSPSAAAPQPLRKVVSSLPKRGAIVNKKLIFGLAAAAAVILAVITYTSYPPATEGTEATIGAAQRAQTPQIASKDVGLGDTSAQDVLQTETWDAIMRDEDFRSTLQDAEVRKLLEDAELRDALRNEAVNRGLQESELARFLKANLSSRGRVELTAQARGTISNANVKAALANDTFARVLARTNLAEHLLKAEARRALSGEAMSRFLRDARAEAALRSARFEQALRTGGGMK